MKAVVGIVLLLSSVGGAAYAQEPVAPDIEILSVIPRSPDVKPYVMALPAEGRPRSGAGHEKQVSAKPETGQAHPGQQTKVAQEK